MNTGKNPEEEARLRLMLAKEAIRAADEGLARASMAYIAQVLSGQIDGVKPRTRLRAAIDGLRILKSFGQMSTQRIEITGPDDGPVKLTLVDLLRETMPDPTTAPARPRKRPTGPKDATHAKRKRRGR